MNMDAKIQQAQMRANQGAAQQQQAVVGLLVQTAGVICGGVLGSEYACARHEASEKEHRFPSESNEDGKTEVQLHVNVPLAVDMSFAAAQMILAKVGIKTGPPPGSQPQGG